MHRVFNASWISLFEFLSVMEKKRKVLMLIQLIKYITNSVPVFLCFTALFVVANWICSAFRSWLVNSTKSTSRISLTGFTKCQNNNIICVGIATNIMEDVASDRRRLSIIDCVASVSRVSRYFIKTFFVFFYHKTSF